MSADFGTLVATEAHETGPEQREGETLSDVSDHLSIPLVGSLSDEIGCSSIEFLSLVAHRPHHREHQRAEGALLYFQHPFVVASLFLQLVPFESVFQRDYGVCGSQRIKYPYVSEDLIH